MAIEDDDKPRKKITHEIGQDLSLLSVEELTERIALMTSEIERLASRHDQKARLERCGEQFFQVVRHVVPAYAGTRTPCRLVRAVCSTPSFLTTAAEYGSPGVAPSLKLRRPTVIPRRSPRRRRVAGTTV